MDKYQRVLEACLREFECEVGVQVEREFARALKALQAGEKVEIPIIGEAFPPLEYCDGLKERVVAALCARKWFEFEAPLWAQPLPLRREDCCALFRHHSGSRPWLVGRYGALMRDMCWDYRRARPFEVHCAMELAQGFA